ncbi:hypothetical protein QF117_20025 [Vibrio sp. YMD68]|uniref:hypothetical protein n=1 Tax=Vibrio sp. YMD68 TaxID=3042300 RepID=UPI00249B964A|nr:hypothetical protein [Vibrio sp. YMD68]WGW00146.1 hypothetical protein QF117_20025 [Vibrio sp. YMD68]
MKSTLIPTLLLSFVAWSSQANVVLKSSEAGKLLVNEQEVQIKQHVYEANDTLISNLTVLEQDGSEMTALVSFDGLGGLFQIRAYGYHQSEGPGYGASYIVDGSCNVIGIQEGTFFELGYIANKNFNEENALYTAYLVEKTPVNGYEGSPFSEETDCTGNAPLSGLKIEHDSNLSLQVNDFFNELVFPIKIR